MCSVLFKVRFVQSWGHITVSPLWCTTLTVRVGMARLRCTTGRGRQWSQVVWRVCMFSEVSESFITDAEKRWALLTRWHGKSDGGPKFICAWGAHRIEPSLRRVMGASSSRSCSLLSERVLFKDILIVARRDLLCLRGRAIWIGFDSHSVGLL